VRHVEKEEKIQIQTEEEKQLTSLLKRNNENSRSSFREVV
jgi:hypothetical protein